MERIFSPVLVVTTHFAIRGIYVQADIMSSVSVQVGFGWFMYRLRYITYMHDLLPGLLPIGKCVLVHSICFFLLVQPFSLCVCACVGVF